MDKISRKSFFQNFISLFREISRNTSEKEQDVLLPPGIVSVNDFLLRCDECYQCVSACPHQAIGVCRQPESDFYGKPIIVPRRQPCYLCNDKPCISVCQPKALRQEFSSRLNGLAQIDKHQCMAFNGLFCRTCVNACPLPDEALFMNMAGQPEVNPEKCNGCGICEFQCPLEQPAIQVIPNQ